MKDKKIEKQEDVSLQETPKSDEAQKEILDETLHSMTESLSAEIKEKDEEIKRLEKQLDEWKQKANNYLNTASYYKGESETHKKDFDRYKERNKNIESEAVVKANTTVAKKLLPILDNFNSAMAVLSPEVMKGFVMIYSSLDGIIKELGISELNPINEALDPEKHNCIDTTSTDDAQLDGTIAKVYQKGYWFAETGEIVRPATVSVYKKDL